MLGRANYPLDFIVACRKRAERQLKLYDALAKKAGKEADAFAPEFFNTMVLALDHYFMHRLRGKEGKDGNPLNEVEMLGDSLMNNGGVLQKSTVLKLVPAESVTKLEFGDSIELTERQFEELAAAFFAELERKFVAPG